MRDRLFAATDFAHSFAKVVVSWHVALLCVLVFVSGCAATLPDAERPKSQLIVGEQSSTLVAMQRRAGIPADQSGAWPLLEPDLALDARLTLIEEAQASLDLQYFGFSGDRVGHTMLNALSRAAERGVHVRLLIDDVGTTGLDGALSNLLRTNNVEVRLFNPFLKGRSSNSGRFAEFALDFRRLQRRMHNKLFVADGAVAIVGGRNIGEEYFALTGQGDFLDFDLLLTGAVLQGLGVGFDAYWNSRYAIPAQELLGPRPESVTSSLPAPSIPTPIRSDVFGASPLRSQLKSDAVRLIPVRATTFADDPAKADGRGLVAFDQTLTHRVFELLAGAKRDVLLISPYFVPAQRGMENIQRSRQAGVRVRVFTNSLAGTDMPLVSAGLRRYRVELLKMGVELYEIGGAPEEREHTMAEFLTSTYGRLHAKVAAVDRKLLLIGSLNLDPRSSRINTELGVAIHSEQLTTMVLDALDLERMRGTFRVKLGPDEKSVRWESVAGDGAPLEYSRDPNTTWWHRLRTFLLSKLIPEELL